MHSVVSTFESARCIEPQLIWSESSCVPPLFTQDINPNDEANTEVDNPDQRMADDAWHILVLSCVSFLKPVALPSYLIN